MDEEEGKKGESDNGKNEKKGTNKGNKKGLDNNSSKFKVGAKANNSDCMNEEAGNPNVPNLDAKKQLQEYRESDFILLDELVYAPLHALATSNHQLRAQVIEAIKSMGDPVGKEETIRLKSLKIAFDQVRPDGDEGYNVDNVQMEVPLLSIVPLTNLSVEKAEIDFSTEVRAKKVALEKYRIDARICSPALRESDFLPRVSYKLEVKSMPAMEGILRLTDQLSSNQIAKRLDSIPVSEDATNSDSTKKKKIDIGKKKETVKKLRQLNQKISNLIAEQERSEQFINNIKKENSIEDVPNCFDKKKFLEYQVEIANKIMKYQREIVENEYSSEMD